jgi:hypothetical protein
MDFTGVLKSDLRSPALRDDEESAHLLVLGDLRSRNIA